jgi:hypothetical protein
MVGKEGDIVFTTLIFIVGTLLLVANFMISSGGKDCKSDKLDKLNKGVLMAGTILTTASVAFGSCHIWCECKDNLGMGIYSWGTFVLGAFMVVIGSMVLKEGASCDKVKMWGSIIIGLGGLMLLLTGSYLAYGFWRKSKAKQLDADLVAKVREQEKAQKAAQEDHAKRRKETGERAAQLAREQAEQQYDAGHGSQTSHPAHSQNTNVSWFASEPVSPSSNASYSSPITEVKSQLFG